MISNKDYYKILGCSETATQEEIAKQYKKLAKKYHPDKQVGKSETEIKTAQETFKNIAEAYSVLKDKDKRAEYDNSRNNPFASAGNTVFNNPFAEFFRGFQRQSQMTPEQRVENEISHIKASYAEILSQSRRKIIPINIEITEKENIYGKKSTQKITLPEFCPDCLGTGLDLDKKNFAVCSLCRGTGQVTYQRGPGMIISEPCPQCHGKQIVNNTPCSRCGQKTPGKILTDYIVNLDLPPGAATINLANTGKPARFSIKVPSKHYNNSTTEFVVSATLSKHSSSSSSSSSSFALSACSSKELTIVGADIYMPVYVDCITATLGGTITVNTPYGEYVLTIPPETPAEKTFIIPNYGIRPTTGKSGNLILTAKITPLYNITNEIQEKLKSIKTDMDNMLLSLNVKQQPEIQKLNRAVYENIFNDKNEP